MKKIFLIITTLLFASNLNAQQFIDKAVIEFEVNTNLKKRMSSNSWSDQIKENMSELKTSYYTYTFAENKSIYKFDRWSEKTRIPSYEKDEDEENIWYFDFSSKKMTMKKQIVSTNFLISDSIPNIEWRLTNENREIAGYNCRKAIGKIMDDVYIFAFYTDQITITGGPCTINGLPGMILGVTIPRLYTSYMATKVSLNNINTSELKPLQAKKTYTNSELKILITEKTKDWFTYGDDKEENNRQKNIFMWEAFL
jgi:GLPGLI family protein